MGSDADPPSMPGSGGDHDDAELLMRWRDGDRHAGNRLVRRYHKAVASTFTNAVGDDDRQDLAQETFKRLTTAKDGFRGQGGVRAYILAIARHVLHDHLRKRYRGSTLFDPLTHSVEDVDGATPSQVVVEAQRTHRLLVCLRALPVDTKLMLELYYWQGCTAEELGRILAGPDGVPLPAGTIRRRIHDAKAKLRACLGDGGAGPDPAPEGDDTDLERDLRALGKLLASGPMRE